MTASDALLASLYLLPLHANRAARVRSAAVGCVLPPELLGVSVVVHNVLFSAETATAPPTSPFIALLMEPLAVPFPCCSSV